MHYGLLLSFKVNPHIHPILLTSIQSNFTACSVFAFIFKTCIKMLLVHHNECLTMKMMQIIYYYKY